MAHLALVWWVITGGLLIAELLTGTFYLLMIATGFAAGAITLNLGYRDGAQFIVGAIVAMIGLATLHVFRRRRRIMLAATGSPGNLPGSDVNLDIGQQVRVDAWQGRRARVSYRGAFWDVEASLDPILCAPAPATDVPEVPGGPGALSAGWYRIEAVRGIVLIVSPVPVSQG